MTILITILTVLNVINVFFPTPLWYNVAMLVFSIVTLVVAIKKRK